MTENSLITKVLYDYQAFDMQTHGGISRCICELYKQLPDTVQATFGIEETDNVYLNQLGFPAQGTAYRHFLSKNNFPLKKAIYKAYYNIRRGHPSRWDKSPLLNEFKTMDLLNQADYDIFHPTFFDTYFLNYLNGKPFVLTIHDMTEELFPQYYPAAIGCSYYCRQRTDQERHHTPSGRCRRENHGHLSWGGRKSLCPWQ